jgi:8-oxo-dGTP pyrophosphatase MutT (NUDIX family)
VGRQGENLAHTTKDPHPGRPDRVGRVTDPLDFPEPPPEAIPAATVVLVRDTPAGLETLMLRRDSKLAFAGGAWVFPGGRIDAEDFPGGERSDDPDALLEAARTAAVRESMEEAGLAVDRDSLVYFAHWTPAMGAPRRFATWFFLARAPEGVVVVDDGEIRDHQWIRPADAITRREAGEVELIPPTWMTLQRLAGFDGVEQAQAELGAGDPEVYLTKIVRVEGGIASVWQGDAAYEDLDVDKPGPRNRLLMLPSGWRHEHSD